MENNNDKIEKKETMNINNSKLHYALNTNTQIDSGVLINYF